MYQIPERYGIKVYGNFDYKNHICFLFKSNFLKGTHEDNYITKNIYKYIPIKL